MITVKDNRLMMLLMSQFVIVVFNGTMNVLKHLVRIRAVNLLMQGR